MPLIPLPIFGPAVFGIKTVANGSTPQTTPQTQHIHFWQKPGCTGAIIATAVGAATTAGEVWAVATLWPGVAVILGEAAAEDGLLGVVHAGEIATLGVATLLAPPIVALAGAAAVVATCF
jgi:hypothetical protein